MVPVMRSNELARLVVIDGLKNKHSRLPRSLLLRPLIKLVEELFLPRAQSLFFCLDLSEECFLEVRESPEFLFQLSHFIYRRHFENPLSGNWWSRKI